MDLRPLNIAPAGRLWQFRRRIALATQPLTTPTIAAANRAAIQSRQQGVPPPDVYDEAFEVKTWWDYHAALTAHHPSGPHTRAVHQLMRDTVRPVLASGRIRSVLDFGVLCGFSLAALAAEFSAIRFVGIDRRAVTKRLNEEHFPQPNTTTSCALVKYPHPDPDIRQLQIVADRR